MDNVLEPPDNEDANNKKPIFASSINISELPIEKQFTHRMFCQQIQNIDLDAALQLLEELHLLYVSQQAVMVKIAKQEFLGGF